MIMKTQLLFTVCKTRDDQELNTIDCLSFLAGQYFTGESAFKISISNSSETINERLH